MKDNKKKVKATEEVKTEKEGTPLTEEELSKVSGGKEQIFAVAEGNVINATVANSLGTDIASK